MLRLRKFVISLLAFLLVFSNGVMSIGAVSFNTTDKYEPVPREDLLNLKPGNNSETIEIGESEDLYDANEEVRVIVEVAGDPAIKYATDKGVKFANLPKAKQLELQNDAFTKQESVKRQIDSKNINMKFEQKFATVFNGFSGFVKFKDIKSIEKLSGVTNVWIATEYERPEVTPDMIYSKDLVEAQRTWDDYEYDGTGMIVGVIDSGVDPSHRDFVLSDDELAALSKDKVEQIVDSEGLPGKYYSAKVPYGYNYMDESDEIRDLGPGASMHGMHVSGTVGANGDEDNGGIKGVAPEAQILGLKVFGNDPEMGSTWADIYIRAIDDSILLGADVINMSLGSVAGFSNHDGPENQAIENAIDHGILFSISAGNSAHLGNGYYNPYVDNPDIGVVGSPGLSVNSLQVASVENSMYGMDAINVKVNGEEDGILPFASQGNVHPQVDGTEYELVYAALGGEEDFEGMDLTGKYALVQRGEHAFTDKALNAQAVGAAGIFIYNNEDGMLNMATEAAVVIPQLFMFKSDGDALAASLQAGDTVTVEFSGDTVEMQNPTAGEMSDFTSWGVAPNLDFKPEITAPGGSILSTFQNDEYGMMSGTSMSAPHVAGGGALILQKVDEKFELEGVERVRMAKNILMNTAEPILDKGELNTAAEIEVPYSPRRQGSGLMKLHAASKTNVVVTEKDSGIAKVALREVGDEFTFTLEATNFGEDSVVYDLGANIQTDFSINGLMGNAFFTGAIDTLEASIMDADITINNGEETITLASGETVSFDVTVDLSEATALVGIATTIGSVQLFAVDPDLIFPNGYFVEGFVTLTDPSDNNPQLSVPYVGFKGDWNDAPILDELDYDGNDSFYEQAGALYPGEEPGNYIYLGHDPFTGGKFTEDIAISPQTDSDQDRIVPLLSYLRNAIEVEYFILDENGNEVRKLRTDTGVRKNYFDGGRAAPYRLDSSLYWDGTLDGKIAEEGQYYFEIRPTIDYPGKEAQSFKIPVQVDVTAPELDLDLDGTVLSIDASDEGSGLRYFELLVNGEPLTLLHPTTTSFDFEQEFPEGTSLTVVAADYAGNQTAVSIGGINDNEGPVIYVDTPDTFQVFATSEVRVAGKVTDASEVVEFTVQGEDVELTWDPEEGHYVFDTVVTLEDGHHVIKLYAKDEVGNETHLANSRSVTVDTQAPVIEVGEVAETVSKDTETIDLTATLSDNFEYLRYYINDNEVFFNTSDDYSPYSVDVTEEVSLDYGENVFTLKLVDLAGHTTTEEVTIFRENLDRINGTSRYDTAVEISKAGWETSDVVVLARGDDFADALAGVPLAHKFDAPLLLTRTGSLPEVTLDEIERLGAKTIYVLGGDLAIGASVKTNLAEEGLEVINIKGDSREETAVEIAKLVIGDGEVDTAVVVNRADFPDALSVASHAAVEGMPILLTATGYLNEATEAALEELGITNTIVVGGSLAISDEVFEELPNPERVNGSNRYATSVAVAERFDADTTEYFVATGKEFPDALAGAALAAKKNTGILLVKDGVSEELADFITNKGLEAITVIGGELAVNNTIVNELAELLE